MSTAQLKQSEKAFEAAVAEYAMLRGWLTYHPFDSRRSQPGFPDRVFVRNGHLLFVEFKTDRGRLSRAQERWLDELDGVAARNETIRVFVWRPADWDLIEQVLA